MPENYLSVQQYAKKHKRSAQSIRIMIAENRLVGVMRIGKSYAIPKNSKYPVLKKAGRKKKNDVTSVKEKANVSRG
jgi:hypothetical protein